MTSSLREEEGGREDPFPNYTGTTRILSTVEPRPHPKHSFVQSSPYLARHDEDILTRTVQDCGLHAYGAIFLEVWVLSSNGRYMGRPSGGHWMDPQFINSISPPSVAQQVNEHAPDCAPGVSLAGTLYNETSQWGNRGVNRKVYWRQIKSMMDDPYLQDDGRLKSLHDDLGIGFVATVPFYYSGRSGIVLFMSRSTCNVDRLMSSANENFLVAAADLIGAAYAIRIPRKELATIRKELMQSAVRKVMTLLKTNKGKRLGSIVDNMRSEGLKPTDSFAQVMFRECSAQSSNKVPDQWRRSSNTVAEYGRIGLSKMSTLARQLSSRVVNSIRKWEGARLKGPARMSAPDCVIIFIMVTLAMLTILKMNDGLEVAEKSHGTDGKKYNWNINGGWYASTMCIVFALSSSPVGQPRQIIGGHIINALVGLAFQRIPSTPNMSKSFGDFAQLAPDQRRGLPLFWKESFAVGVGVAAQAWLGVMHPPATGLAFSFAQSNRFQLSNLVVVILADLILISLATGLLNLQEKKQYPMFWFGFSWKYPNGYEQFTNTTKTELTERSTKKKGKDKTDRNESTPQDRATTITSATGCSGVENV